MICLGFTTLELLCALMLSTLLLVAILGVVAGMSRNAASIGDKGNAPGLAVQRQLRLDITTCQNFKLTSNALTLVGYLSRDEHTSERTGRSATVIYEIITSKSRPLLFRQQVLQDKLNNAGDHSELLLTGVQRFQIQLGEDDRLLDTYGGPLPARR